MKVSVVIPLYDKVGSIARCLRSIAAQDTSAEFEIIVVDDGSTDASRDVAEAFDDPRIRVVAQENAGPGAARNTGAQVARGELLAFLDADDEWQPNYLSHAIARLEAAGPDVAMTTSGYVAFPENRDAARMWRNRGIEAGRFQITPDTAIERILAYIIYVTAGTTVIRRSVFRSCGGFYDRTRALFGEDTYLWLDVLLHHAAIFDFEPNTSFHMEDSDLSRITRGARPIEAFLEDPERLRQRCPPELTTQLERVLSARAYKTACMLGYWGLWGSAADLIANYRQAGDRQLPYFWRARAMATPLGSWAGRVHRGLAKTPLARMA